MPKQVFAGDVRIRGPHWQMFNGKEWVNMHKEYIRRNLVHAGSIGVRAGIAQSIHHLRLMKRPPKWLVKQLEALYPRADQAAHELARWRNSAPDAPPGVRDA